MLKNKTNLLFLSSDTIAIPCIEALASNFNLQIITKSDKSQKRSKQKKANEFAHYCDDNNIQSIRIDKFDSTTIEQIKNFDSEYAVCFSFGLIIPNVILDLFPNKLINIHPSILPIYRGPSPIQAALLNNDKSTAISFMIMNAKMDEGDVLKQISLDIAPSDTYQSLASKIAQIAGNEIDSILSLYMANSIQPIPQVDANAIYCKMINKSDAQIDWQLDAQDIYNKFRAFNDWPKVYTFWKTKKLILSDIEVYPSDSKEKPGTIFKHGDSIFVKANTGALKLNSIQLEGKKNMTIQNFINGHADFIGSVLG
jgi:methionyl-tRNA formyltransferase